MYCVVQEIQNKKQNPYGAHKELEVYTWGYDGVVVYAYGWSEERFERPIKTSYKITLRESRRVNGKVKAKIWTLKTISYYSMAEYGYYEDVERPLQDISDETGIPLDKLYDIVEAKLEPLYERIRAEYEQTEEYKTSQRNSAITRKYAEEKIKFEKIYGNNTYDRCYDVFGTLRNAAYLEQLKQNHSYYKKQRSNYNSYSYQNYFKGNYNSSSYQQNISSNYTEEDKVKLKKCFKILAKYFHPDSATGDTELMQFINDKLKKEWKL